MLAALSAGTRVAVSAGRRRSIASRSLCAIGAAIIAVTIVVTAAATAALLTTTTAAVALAAATLFTSTGVTVDTATAGVAISSVAVAAATTIVATVLTTVSTVVSTVLAVTAVVAAATVIATATVLATAIAAVAVRIITTITATAASVTATAAAIVKSIIETTPTTGTCIFALGRAKVFARSRGAGTGTASLLDAQGATLDDFALKTLFGSIGHIRSHHLDESEATGFLAVGIAHNLALLDLTVLLEEARNLSLGQLRVDTSDEKVGSRVDGTIITTVIAHLRVGLRSAVTVVVWGRRAAARRLVAVIASGRRAAVAIVARSILLKAISSSVLVVHCSSRHLGKLCN